MAVIRIADERKLALVVELRHVLAAVAGQDVLGLHGEIRAEGVAKRSRFHRGKAGLEVGDAPGVVVGAVLVVDGVDVGRGAVVEDEARRVDSATPAVVTVTLATLRWLVLAVRGAPDHAVGLAADLEDVVLAEFEVVRVGESGVVVGEVVDAGVEAGVADAEVAGGQERELVVAVVGEQVLTDDEDLAGLQLRDSFARKSGEGTAAGPDQVIWPAGAVEPQFAVVAENETAVSFVAKEALPVIVVIIHGIFVDVVGGLPDLGSVFTPEDHVVVVADGQLRSGFLAGIGGNDDGVFCLGVANNKLAVFIQRCDHVAVVGGDGLTGSQVLSGADFVTGCDRGELHKMSVYFCFREGNR